MTEPNTNLPWLESFAGLVERIKPGICYLSEADHATLTEARAGIESLWAELLERRARLNRKGTGRPKGTANSYTAGAIAKRNYRKTGSYHIEREKPD